MCKRVLSHYFFVLLALAGLMIVSACQSKKAEEDPLLAQVFNRTLHLSDLDGLFPEGTTSSDSTLIIGAFTNRWIREALVLTEAERNLPSDLNIDKLVRDYRASLIRHNYEQALVEQLLDSTVSQKELSQFYEANKEQYQLETPIIRCRFLKVPSSLDLPDSLRFWWNDSDHYMEQIRAFAEKGGAAYILNDSSWTRLDELSPEAPGELLEERNIKSKTKFQHKNADFTYFFELLEMKNSTEIAPLGFIEGQARKAILHNRKLKLLEEKRESLYELHMRQGNVKIFDFPG